MEIVYCAHCGKKLDAHCKVSDKADPSPGDFSVCGYCGGVYRFNKRLVLRPVSEDDFLALRHTDPKLFLNVLRVVLLVQCPTNPLHLSNRKN